jgi:hypothetical protein
VGCRTDFSSSKVTAWTEMGTTKRQMNFAEKSSVDMQLVTKTEARKKPEFDMIWPQNDQLVLSQ